VGDNLVAQSLVLLTYETCLGETARVHLLVFEESFSCFNHFVERVHLFYLHLKVFAVFLQLCHLHQYCIFKDLLFLLYFLFQSVEFSPQVLLLKWSIPGWLIRRRSPPTIKRLLTHDMLSISCILVPEFLLDLIERGNNVVIENRTIYWFPFSQTRAWSWRKTWVVQNIYCLVNW